MKNHIEIESPPLAKIRANANSTSNRSFGSIFNNDINNILDALDPQLPAAQVAAGYNSALGQILDSKPGILAQNVGMPDQRAAVALGATFPIAFASSLLGGMMGVLGRRLVAILLALRGRFGFLLLFELLPQFLHFIGEFVLISTECLDDIKQFLNRLLCLVGQVPRSGEQRLHLYQNRLDIHSAHTNIIRN